MKTTGFRNTEDDVAFNFLDIVADRKSRCRKCVLQTRSAKEEAIRIEHTFTYKLFQK